ncbi:hypothetical protein EI94DRAFT_1698616 [Lactarius quietus]|nr:hypothetical protein EI94DRAFT_1698616 [Lactarius quietus]
MNGARIVGARAEEGNREERSPSFQTAEATRRSEQRVACVCARTSSRPQRRRRGERSVPGDELRCACMHTDGDRTGQAKIRPRVSVKLHREQAAERQGGGACWGMSSTARACVYGDGDRTGQAKIRLRVSVKPHREQAAERQGGGACRGMSSAVRACGQAKDCLCVSEKPDGRWGEASAGAVPVWGPEGAHGRGGRTAVSMRHTLGTIRRHWGWGPLGMVTGT